MGAMSRLRRLVVSDRWFFVTCRVLPRRGILSASEFGCLARVIQERREEHGFLLSAGVFLPDHGHAIIYPPYPLTISTVKAGLVSRPEDWRWSSVHDYTGTINQAPITPSGLSVDRVSLPADPRTRI